MVAKRFYIDKPLETNQSVILADQEFIHLSKVMRIKPSETVELVNGQGTLAMARVETLRKKEAELFVLKSTFLTFSPFCILAQALPRINRLDFIVEKGTELGMDELWLFPGEQSERTHLTEMQLNRLKLVAIAAMKQSGRLYLPKIILKPCLKKWEEPNYPAYFGDVSSFAPHFSLVLKKQPFLFVVGPETGFTTQESDHLKTLNAIGAKLHHNILRTDTASLAALSIASAFYPFKEAT